MRSWWSGERVRAARALTWLTLAGAAITGCHATDGAPAESPSTRESAGGPRPAEGALGARVEPMYLLRAPRPEVALAGPVTPEPPTQAGDGWGWLGRSVSRDVPIYNTTRGRRFEIGGLRLGAAVRLRPSEARRGNCRGGWFKVEPRGFACLSNGLRVSNQELPDPAVVLSAPDPNAQLPFRYVHVHDRSAWLYGRVPDADERDAVLARDEDAIEELEARSMDGGYFLAIESDDDAHSDRWLRTLHGNFVRRDATREIEPSKLQGAFLDDELTLPVAFVVEDRAPVYAQGEGGRTSIGLAQRYARVPIDRRSVDDDLLRIAGSDRFLRAQDVRLATRRPMPSDVEDGERWLHVDIANQTLVAYEGAEPRFATLIASGLSPRDTPTGDYDVRYKYRTTTMRGEDENGPFEVQEVPWTMFYYKSYAIHGAYWHDAFGAPRSHGCTNLAPLDARWVFHFTSPDLPPGWERVAERGTHVVFTNRDSDA